MVRRLWSDHGTACDGYAACSERPKRGEKRYRADSIAQVFEKRGSSHRFKRQPSSPCDDEVLHRHSASRSLFVANYHFRICRLAQGQNARAGNWAKAKNRREQSFLAWLRFQ